MPSCHGQLVSEGILVAEAGAMTGAWAWGRIGELPWMPGLG